MAGAYSLVEQRNIQMSRSYVRTITQGNLLRFASLVVFLSVSLPGCSNSSVGNLAPDMANANDVSNDMVAVDLAGDLSMRDRAIDTNVADFAEEGQLTDGFDDSHQEIQICHHDNECPSGLVCRPTLDEGVYNQCFDVYERAFDCMGCLPPGVLDDLCGEKSDCGPSALTKTDPAVFTRTGPCRDS